MLLPVLTLEIDIAEPKTIAVPMPAPFITLLGVIFPVGVGSLDQLRTGNETVSS